MSHDNIIRPPHTRKLRYLFTLGALLILFALAAGPLASRRAARAAVTFVVNSTGDGADSNTGDGVCSDAGGQCTLRAAIEQANAAAGADTINFQIGSGVQTITLNTDLPIITSPLVIDGTTQPGFTGSPLIEINGTNARNRAGLSLHGGDSTVRGLVLNRFGTAAIGIQLSGNNRVEGNYVGTDVTGTVRMGNGFGISIFNSVNNTIGGLSTAQRNVISGNGGSGIEVGPTSATGNLIQGNYIGVNASGDAALFNGGNGISILGAVGNTIGGTAPGAGNVISGNGMNGIEMGGQMTTVQGNLIGTNASGTAAIRNSDRGIRVFNSPNNTIGGTAPGARNIISGNFAAGVSIEESGATGNVVQGNLIGTDVTGAAPLPNSPEGFGVPNTSGGVFINRGSNNVVGGSASGAPNTIAYNGSAGVRVVTLPNTSVGIGNDISRNSIFGNLGLGIDLGAGGVTPNDAGDGDGDANRLQNFPLITSVASAGGATNVQGSLNSAPNTTFRVDFFVNRGCHPSGNGEGARAFGSTQVTTDGAGAAVFSVSIQSSLSAGQVLTVTATDPSGNTSEYSPCDAAGATGLAQFAATTFRVRSDIGTLLVPVVRVGGSRGELTVNFSTRDDTAIAGQHYTAASGTLIFGDGETGKTIPLPITSVSGSSSRTLFLTLSNASAPEVVGASGITVVRIFGNNSGIVVGFGGTTVKEGDDGTTNAVIPVGLSLANGKTVTVNYTTLGLTAASGVDFQPVSGSLTFNPGETIKEVTVPVIGDRLDEPDETFSLSLSDAVNAFIDISSNPPLSVITDDDPPPSVSVSGTGIAEPATGTASAVFNVSLSYPSAKQVSVNFATSDGTAQAGSDYQAASGTVVFNAGEVTKTVSVVVNSDAADEPLETFLLNLSNPVNSTVAAAPGTGTIAPANSAALQFSAPSYSAREGEHSVDITVTRTGHTSGAASVEYATSDLTATERKDYTTALGTLRFAPGESSKVFTVLLSDDAYQEGDETLILALTNPAGAFVNGPNNALLVIHDEGASAHNPIDASQPFVRQHYHDFLNREPDAPGLAFWTQEIEQCGADAQCREVKRINVSAAFFLSIEFQETGYLAYRTYKAAYGDATSPNVPGTVPVVRFREFLADARRVGQNVQVNVGDWEQQLEANKQAYMLEFVQRQRFTDAFPQSLTVAQFVDRLDQNAGGVLSPAERDQLVAELAAAPDQVQGRASALRKVAEDVDLRNRERDRAFVLMQYFGYLRRNPDDAPDANYAGWKFWLDKLNQFGGNYVEAEMVKAFISSTEYRQRFGQ